MMRIKTLSSLLFLFCLLSSSCFYGGEKNPLKQKSKNIPPTNFDYLIPEFKVYFFCRCLNKGYQNSHVIKEVLKQDNSIASDYPLGTKSYRLMDSLAQQVNLEITQDSIQIAKRFCNGECEDKEELERYRANGIIGRRIMKHCLDYYESEELDSIVRNALTE